MVALDQKEEEEEAADNLNERQWPLALEQRGGRQTRKRERAPPSDLSSSFARKGVACCVNGPLAVELLFICFVFRLHQLR